MHGMEEQIARQKNRLIHEEIREIRLARLARTGDGPSRIRASLADVLNVHHEQRKEA